ncbi:PREDICTED: homeobox-leucine zipper protein ATHB-22-like [Nelumbo nucifera]|uniref:Homeobox-leucine zipper protein n=2 Tax=Nelumbo nucifera TaxID=4432 RepID=A0A1U7YV78_NELNU|nr:PREDICTED: homeobox-leucine zipper protein ATHB-22-like [Nelumbo nucifera]DAD48702.1 TPA_asm: hypothetical protein HUJ06_018639 [Nelumbo nucifera]
MGDPKMDWNCNFRSSASRAVDHTFTFLFDSSYDHPFAGMEMKRCPAEEMVERSSAIPSSNKRNDNQDNHDNSNHNNQEIRKRRLTGDQIKSLERSFQEEMKLEPERKMRLARELGLQPRQVAVWFQNRRARWKAKQLERVYGALKHEFDVISREKQKLQEEVMKLRAKLEERATAKQGSTVHTEGSAEETVESASVASRSSNKLNGSTNHPQIAECSNCIFNSDDYNPALPPFWVVMPGYP